MVSRTGRTDLPDVTCSWNHPSGEVDLRVSPAFACDDGAPRCRPASMPSEDCTDFVELTNFPQRGPSLW